MSLTRPEQRGGVVRRWQHSRRVRALDGAETKSQIPLPRYTCETRMRLGLPCVRGMEIARDWNRMSFGIRP